MRKHLLKHFNRFGIRVDVASSECEERKRWGDKQSAAEHTRHGVFINRLFKKKIFLSPVDIKK